MEVEDPRVEREALRAKFPELTEFVPDPEWPKLGRYRHYKGGEYTLILVSYDKETEEPLVHYLSEQPTRGMPTGTPWTCTLSQWTEMVEGDGCVPVPRFIRVGNKPT